MNCLSTKAAGVLGRKFVCLRSPFPRRGSFCEIMEDLVTAYDERYVDKKSVDDCNWKYKVCLKEINSYIKYLKTAKLSPIINN
jgi:hypothetical protein